MVSSHGYGNPSYKFAFYTEKSGHLIPMIIAPRKNMHAEIQRQNRNYSAALEKSEHAC